MVGKEKGSTRSSHRMMRLLDVGGYIIELYLFGILHTPKQACHCPALADSRMKSLPYHAILNDLPKKVDKSQV
jgi:hypothetical protein